MSMDFYFSSESRNPFVEYAVQYAVATAYVIFDKNKKDALHKLLLQGNVLCFGCCCFSHVFGSTKHSSSKNLTC